MTPTDSARGCSTADASSRNVVLGRRRDLIRFLSLLLLAAAFALALSGCGTSNQMSRREAEVRALYKAVAAAGRAHRFAVICNRYQSGLLKQLDYLFKVDCPKHFVSVWVEGVHLAHIGPSTRITISGGIATVFDGASPDRAVFEQGHWKLLESPRNDRHDRRNEALEIAKELDPGFRKEHLPELNSQTRGPNE
jgi:hypothetical protein